MRTQVFKYRFKEDADVETWSHGKQSKKQYKKGDIIGVIGYADDEDRHAAGQYGHAGDKGFQYMGDSAKGSRVTGALEDGSHIELCSSAIEPIS